MTARKQLEVQLRKLIPKAWRLIAYQDSLDAISNVTVMLKQESITKAPFAPQGAHLVTYTVTLIDPATDPKKAELALDENVNDLLYKLDTVEWIMWSRAEKVQFAEFNMAYDISLEVITRKAI